MMVLLGSSADGAALVATRAAQSTAMRIDRQGEAALILVNPGLRRVLQAGDRAMPGAQLDGKMTISGASYHA
jgi:hypothetical protein